MLLDIAIVLYLVATVLLVGAPWIGADARWVSDLCGACALALHLGSLYPLIVGWAPSVGNFYSMAIAAMTLLIILVSRKIPSARPLLVLLYPAAALSLPFIQTLTLGTEATPGLKVHLGLSVLALGLVVLASMQALILAMRDHSLHGGRLGYLTARMPPLQEMDVFLFRLIGAAFFLLSLSLASGLAYPAAEAYDLRITHKTMLSLLAWMIFGALLVGRWLRGWRGVVAVRWTLGGSAILLLAYFGSLLMRPPPV